MTPERKSFIFLIYDSRALIKGEQLADRDIRNINSRPTQGSIRAIVSDYNFK